FQRRLPARPQHRRDPAAIDDAPRDGCALVADTDETDLAEAGGALRRRSHRSHRTAALGASSHCVKYEHAASRLITSAYLSCMSRGGAAGLPPVRAKPQPSPTATLYRSEVPSTPVARTQPLVDSPATTSVSTPSATR